MNLAFLYTGRTNPSRLLDRCYPCKTALIVLPTQLLAVVNYALDVIGRGREIVTSPVRTAF